MITWHDSMEDPPDGTVVWVYDEISNTVNAARFTKGMSLREDDRWEMQRVNGTFGPIIEDISAWTEILPVVPPPRPRRTWTAQ